VDGSTLTDTIIGASARIKGAQLRNSLIGDHVIIEGLHGELTVSDHSEIRGDSL
jgi:hypothetical protein